MQLGVTIFAETEYTGYSWDDRGGYTSGTFRLIVVMIVRQAPNAKAGLMNDGVHLKFRMARPLFLSGRFHS